jgi:hypothetical protein
MRWKKLLLLVCLFLLLGAVTVWASDTYEWYRGKPVSVFINDQQVNTRGLLMQMGNDSKVMMPLRDVADMLQAMVTWNADTQTVRMYKPNVHIFLSTMNKDGSFGTFGKVYHKEKHDFFIFTQIDSLVRDVHSLKFEILDPNGKKVYEHEHVLNGTTDDVLWVRTPNIQLEFAHRGEYKVKLYMKLSASSPYHLVSEKVFHSSSR